MTPVPWDTTASIFVLLTTLTMTACCSPMTELQDILKHWADVSWVQSTDSTNGQLLQLARQPWRKQDWPRLLGADRQSQGRGRAGRPWLNETGQTLMFSCGFLVDQTPRELVGLAPALGLVTCQTLREFAQTHQAQDTQRLTMKWPNDLMLDDGKLAGILVESRIRGSRTLIVIGMGLNLTHGQHVGQQLNRTVGDWNSFVPGFTQHADLVATVAQSWQKTVQVFDSSHLRDLVHSHRNLDYLFGKAVNIIQNDQILMSGTACGWSDDGRLSIRSDQSDAVMHHITVGDISVRPSMGLSS